MAREQRANIWNLATFERVPKTQTPFGGILEGWSHASSESTRTTPKRSLVMYVA